MRLDQVKNYLSSNVFAVDESTLQGIIQTVNNGEIKALENIPQEEKTSLIYDVIGEVAVISIDGAMLKRHSWITAQCSSMISYDSIASAIDKAVENNNVTKIVFNVDTAGGDVAGADELGEKIRNCPKKTIAYGNNLLASAGVWIFSACDEIYAGKTTWIGSIGVLATFRKQEESDSTIYMTSANAENKFTKDESKTKDKIQSRIDATEKIFYERIERNTGFSREQIKTTFNSGDVIFADEAKEAGFIKEVCSFDDLMNSLATMPSGNEKIVPKNLNYGDKSMELTQANLDALKEDNKILKADLSQAQADGKENKAQLDKTNKLFATFKKNTTDIVCMAFEHGVNKETAMKMIDCDTVADAGLVVLNTQKSDGSTVSPNTEDSSENQAAESWERVPKMRGE